MFQPIGENFEMVDLVFPDESRFRLPKEAIEHVVLDATSAELPAIIRQHWDNLTPAQRRFLNDPEFLQAMKSESQIFRQQLAVDAHGDKNVDTKQE